MPCRACGCNSRERHHGRRANACPPRRLAPRGFARKQGTGRRSLVKKTLDAAFAAPSRATGVAPLFGPRHHHPSAHPDAEVEPRVSIAAGSQLARPRATPFRAVAASKRLWPCRREPGAVANIPRRSGGLWAASSNECPPRRADAPRRVRHAPALTSAQLEPAPCRSRRDEPRLRAAQTRGISLGARGWVLNRRRHRRCAGPRRLQIALSLYFRTTSRRNGLEQVRRK